MKNENSFNCKLKYEEALEQYMIKLIDEAEEHLANDGKTIPFEEWQEKMRRKYNVTI